MLTRFLFALCTLLTLVPSFASAQQYAYVNVPFNPQGANITYQANQPYDQGTLVSSNGQLCVSLKPANQAPLSDTTSWNCSAASSGLTQAQQNAINGALQTSGGTMIHISFLRSHTK